MARPTPGRRQAANAPWIVFALASTAMAETWVVDPAGGGDALTIQAGMALATVGDRVLVQPGTYVENVFLKSGVHLEGAAGPDLTTLAAAKGSFCASGDGLTDVLIEGLTFTGVSHAAYAYTGWTALHLDGDAEIRNCAVVNNYALDGAIDARGTLAIYETRFAHNFGGTDAVDAGSIQFEGGSLHVERCVFDDDVDLYSGHPVIRAQGQVVLRGNVVRRCGAMNIEHAWPPEPTAVICEDNLFWKADGLNCSDDVVHAEIRGNTFVESSLSVTAQPSWIIERNLVTGSEGCGIWLEQFPPGAQVSCNNVWGNTRNWCRSNRAGLDGNISAAPKYCNPSIGDFHLASNSPCLAANNGCSAQIGAFGQGCGTIAVDAWSWGLTKAAFR